MRIFVSLPNFPESITRSQVLTPRARLTHNLASTASIAQKRPSHLHKNQKLFLNSAIQPFDNYLSSQAMT
jgi:hypothetical protein